MERDEWLLLLGMIADIRAEIEDIYDVLTDEEDDGETEKDS